MTLGQIQTNRGYPDIARDLTRVFRKWGIREYQVPSWSAVTAAGLVTVEYIHHGRPVVLTPTKVGKSGNWQSRQLLAIERMLDSVRKAEQRGLVEGMAEASAAIAMLPAPVQKKPAYAVIGVMPDAEPEVVKAAYRARLMKLHPDHGGPGGGALAELLEAGKEMRVG